MWWIAPGVFALAVLMALLDRDTPPKIVPGPYWEIGLRRVKERWPT